MKIIFVFILFMHAFTLNSNAKELEDCSAYSKLNPKYLACKAKNIAKNTIKYQTEQWSEVNKNKNKKTD